MTTTPAEDRAALLRRHRRPEPTFVRAVATALGDARTVLEMRSGPVSYVPTDRSVVTEAPADATLVTFPTAGDLADSVRRVSGPVVALARDPDRLRAGWLDEYAHEVVVAEAATLPTLDELAAVVGSSTEIIHLPVPFTCVDGFAEAYYARPERLLEPDVRAADPLWSRVDDLTARRAVSALRTALETGTWDDRHGALRRRPTLDGSVVLLTPGGLRADRRVAERSFHR